MLFLNNIHTQYAIHRAALCAKGDCINYIIYSLIMFKGVYFLTFQEAQPHVFQTIHQKVALPRSVKRTPGAECSLFIEIGSS